MDFNQSLFLKADQLAQLQCMCQDWVCMFSAKTAHNSSVGITFPITTDSNSQISCTDETIVYQHRTKYSKSSVDWCIKVHLSRRCLKVHS